MRVATVVKRWGLTKDGRRATFAKETCSVVWEACTYDCKDGDDNAAMDAMGNREPMQDPDPSVHWHVDGFHALNTLLRDKDAFLPTQRVQLRARVRGDLRLKNVRSRFQPIKLNTHITHTNCDRNTFAATHTRYYQTAIHAQSI